MRAINRGGHDGAVHKCHLHRRAGARGILPVPHLPQHTPLLDPLHPMLQQRWHQHLPGGAQVVGLSRRSRRSVQAGLQQRSRGARSRPVGLARLLAG